MLPVLCYCPYRRMASSPANPPLRLPLRPSLKRPTAASSIGMQRARWTEADDALLQKLYTSTTLTACEVAEIVSDAHGVDRSATSCQVRFCRLKKAAQGAQSTECVASGRTLSKRGAAGRVLSGPIPAGPTPAGPVASGPVAAGLEEAGPKAVRRGSSGPEVARNGAAWPRAAERGPKECGNAVESNHCAQLEKASDGAAPPGRREYAACAGYSRLGEERILAKAGEHADTTVPAMYAARGATLGCPGAAQLERNAGNEALADNFQAPGEAARRSRRPGNGAHLEEGRPARQRVSPGSPENPPEVVGGSVGETVKKEHFLWSVGEGGGSCGRTCQGAPEAGRMMAAAGLQQGSRSLWGENRAHYQHPDRFLHSRAGERYGSLVKPASATTSPSAGVGSSSRDSEVVCPSALVSPSMSLCSCPSVALALKMKMRRHLALRSSPALFESVVATLYDMHSGISLGSRGFKLLSNACWNRIVTDIGFIHGQPHTCKSLQTIVLGLFREGKDLKKISSAVALGQSEEDGNQQSGDDGAGCGRGVSGNVLTEEICESDEDNPEPIRSGREKSLWPSEHVDGFLLDLWEEHRLSETRIHKIQTALSLRLGVKQSAEDIAARLIHLTAPRYGCESEQTGNGDVNDSGVAGRREEGEERDMRRCLSTTQLNSLLLRLWDEFRLSADRMTKIRTSLASRWGITMSTEVIADHLVHLTAPPTGEEVRQEDVEDCETGSQVSPGRSSSNRCDSRKSTGSKSLVVSSVFPTVTEDQSPEPWEPRRAEDEVVADTNQDPESHSSTRRVPSKRRRRDDDGDGATTGSPDCFAASGPSHDGELMCEGTSVVSNDGILGASDTSAPVNHVNSLKGPTTSAVEEPIPRSISVEQGVTAEVSVRERPPRVDGEDHGNPARKKTRPGPTVMDIGPRFLSDDPVRYEEPDSAQCGVLIFDPVAQNVRWTAEEDEMLFRIADHDGNADWVWVAAQVSLVSGISRTSDAVKSRYRRTKLRQRNGSDERSRELAELLRVAASNHGLGPNQAKNNVPVPWTDAEDKALVELAKTALRGHNWGYVAGLLLSQCPGPAPRTGVMCHHRYKHLKSKSKHIVPETIYLTEGPLDSKNYVGRVAKYADSAFFREESDIDLSAPPMCRIGEVPDFFGMLHQLNEWEIKSPHSLRRRRPVSASQVVDARSNEGCELPDVAQSDAIAQTNRAHPSPRDTLDIGREGEGRVEGAQKTTVLSSALRPRGGPDLSRESVVGCSDVSSHARNASAVVRESKRASLDTQMMNGSHLPRACVNDGAIESR